VRVVRVANNQDNVHQGGLIRVAVWNIAHGRGTAPSNLDEKPEPKVKRVMEIARVIRQWKADIVVLNEVDFSATWSGGFDQAQAIAEEAGFPFYARQCNLDFGFLYGRWKIGNVILSRFPITDAQAVDLPPFSTWEDWFAGRKRGVLCTVDVGSSRHVKVMGLHLESRSEDCRVESARFLADEISKIEGPLIVAGDLNTTPGGAPHSQETADGENAFDLLIASTNLQAEPLRVLDAKHLTYPARAPGKTIDWILFRPDYFSGGDHQVFPTGLSDHRPVMMTLNLKLPGD